MKRSIGKMVLAVVLLAACGVAFAVATQWGNFDKNTSVNTNDYVYLKAYVELVAAEAPLTAANLAQRANTIKSSISATNTNIDVPAAGDADFDKNTNVNTNDYVYLKAYVELVAAEAPLTAANLAQRANTIKSSISATNTNLNVPGTATSGGTTTGTTTGTASGTAVTIDIQTQE